MTIRCTRSNNFNNAEVLSAGWPPEAVGALPIVGHLLQLVGSTPPLFKKLRDMSDKYGPIFMVRLGMYPTLVVSSWEICKECFTTNDRFLADRPSAASSNKHLTFAMYAFSMYGSYWREIHKISTIHLLSQRRIQLFKHIPYLETSDYIKRLHQRWMKSQSQQNSTIASTGLVKVDMTQVFRELTLNVMLKVIVGKSIFIKNKDDHEDATVGYHNKEEEQEGIKLHKTIIEFFTLAGTSVACDVLPFLGWLDVDGQKRHMKRVAKEMDLFASIWLEEHRQKKRLQTWKTATGGTNNNHDDENDFMYAMMSVLDEENGNLFFGYNRDSVIKATCLQLILAGSDSTSITLTWALSLLLSNPSALRKAQDELDNKVGKNRNVEGSDINDLVYLQAVVKETLRLYPPGPLSLAHEAIEDCNVGGYKVKAGTRLFVNLWKLHRDPRVWSNPLDFKPERFLPNFDGDGVCGEAANMDFRGQDFGYIPFGSGRRMCPGINFAIQNIHMVLARFLHAFDFTAAGGLEIDMPMEGSGLTVPKATPLEVHIIPRLPVTLYL
ncbi:cytochrome P450 CYP82D47-like [Papaver somniferum]|nr:cytochrome P450 CYP82D47-like [Papaver somniferum]